MGITKNLVLGGSGTIGTALCKHLKDIKEEVINLDLQNGFDLRTNDLDSYHDVDYVWFLAWDVGGAKYLMREEHQLGIIYNNTLICQKVFSFLEKTKLPFMFASSQLASPDNTYGVTKILGERWTNLLHGQVVRFWNVYGWEEPGERSHVIPDLILQALTKKRIQLLTDGQEERQFIYIDDCVENMVAIRNAGLNRVDITNGEWLTIEKIAREIAGELNVPVFPGNTKGYSNKITPYFISNKLVFKTSIREGISRIITDAQKYTLKENSSAI